MTLILSVTRYRNEALASPPVARIESGVFSIGRGADNDLALSDPELHLSKKHCLIRHIDGQYVITDISTNGVFINGSAQALGNGGNAVLADGDRLVLGDYDMLVEIRSPTPARAVPADPWPPAGQGGTPFDGPGIFGASNADISAKAPSANPWMPPGQGGSPFDSANIFGADGPLLPSVPPRRDAAFPPAGDLSSAGGVNSGILQNAPAINDYLARPLITADPAPPPADMPASLPPIDLPEDFDILKEPDLSKRHPLIEALRKGPRQQPAQQPAQPAVNSAEFIAPPVAPPPRAPVPAPAVAPPPTAPRDDVAWREFLSAARLEPGAFGAEDPADLMRALGRVFREMVVGLKDLLATRDRIKTEYRVQRTVVQAADNNPLKFTVDPGQAAAMLLTRPQPGYLVGPKAVNEAFRDVKAHEIAYMVGMQAALASLLRQFDPEGLKQQFDKQKGRDSLLGNRQSKYWVAYEEHYRQIASDINENARSVFGLAFAKAYEEQLKKL